MTTETKINTLLEKVEQDYRRALDVYKEARRFRIKSKEIISQLPDFITEHRWYSFKEDGDGFYLETYVLDEPEADDIIKKLKLSGIFGLKPTFKTSSGGWYYKGSLMIGEFEVTIMVDGGSSPPNCRIEETKETREVTTYKAICPETGEEL